MSLFDPQANYAEHDTFLHALLGVAHANQVLENLLKTAAAEIPINDDMTRAKHDDECFIEALLGLAALAETADRVIQSWREQDHEPVVEADTRPLGFEVLGDIMR